MLLGALVALVIGEVADQVVASSSAAARRSLGSWVAAVSPIVDESTAVAPVLDALRRDATTADRAALDRRLGFVEAQSAAARRQLAALPLAPPDAVAGAGLARVIDGRAAAATALGEGIDLATDAGAGTGSLARAQADLQTAAAAAAAADAAYVALRSHLARPARGDLPARSVWLSHPSAWTAASLSAWAGALRATPALAARPGLALTAVSVSPSVLEVRGLPTATTTTPTSSTTTTSTTTTTTTTTTTATTGSTGRTTTSTTGPGHGGGSGRRTTTTTAVPVVTTTTLQVPPAGSLSVLQPTSHLAVTAVVADRGSLPVAGVRLVATLTPDGGGAVQQVERRLGGLAPGTARFVELGGMRPRRGDRYELAVTATGTGVAGVTAQVALCDASASGSCP